MVCDSAGPEPAGGAGTSGSGRPRGNPNLAPRCGAKTRADLACQAPGMANGRCRIHGGTSTGPRTAKGSRGWPPLARRTGHTPRQIGSGTGTPGCWLVAFGCSVPPSCSGPICRPRWRRGWRRRRPSSCRRCTTRTPSIRKSRQRPYGAGGGTTGGRPRRDRDRDHRGGRRRACGGAGGAGGAGAVAGGDRRGAAGQAGGAGGASGGSECEKPTKTLWSVGRCPNRVGESAEGRRRC